MNEIKTQVTVRFPADVKNRIQLAMEAFGHKSQNEYIVEAVKFYTGYLLSKDGVKTLFPELMKQWEADLETSNNRMGSLLFKTAVELNMLSNLQAAVIDVTDDDMRKLRSRCVREVKQTKGKISLDDAMHYQHDD